MRSFTLVVALACLVAGVAATPAGCADGLLLNSGFQSPSISAGSDSASVDIWQATNAGILNNADNSFFPAGQSWSTQIAYLNNGGTLFQALPGYMINNLEGYELSFELGLRSDKAADGKPGATLEIVSADTKNRLAFYNAIGSQFVSGQKVYKSVNITINQANIDRLASNTEGAGFLIKFGTNGNNPQANFDNICLKLRKCKYTYGEWSEWDVTCDNATRTRTENCHCGSCIEPQATSDTKYQTPCGKWYYSPWSAWNLESCLIPNGLFKRTRTEICVDAPCNDPHDVTSESMCGTCDA